VRPITLLDLVRVIHAVADTPEEAAAVVRELLRSGRVKLVGSARTRRALSRGEV
jgi:hypothetical protein